MPINFLSDIIPVGQRTIAFFTTGPQFVINPNNTGYTGAWLVDTNKIFNGLFVLIYLRGNIQNTIYQATLTGIQGPFIDDEGRNRYGLDLANVQAVGITNNNWRVCAQTYRQTFRYYN